jgi:membrane fusion protein (multidrug efflux system)
MTSVSNSPRAIFLIVAGLVMGCRPDPEGDPTGDATEATEVSVEVARVVRTTLHGYVDAFGSVIGEPAAAGRPAGAALLAAPVAGLVIEVSVSEGQLVRTGDLVVRLDDRIAKADVARARSSIGFAEQSFEREKALLAQDNTSQQKYEVASQALSLAKAELARAEGLLAQVQLRSPLNGVVAAVHARPGQSVDLNTVVAEIVDLHRLAIEATIPMRAALMIRQGQTGQAQVAGKTVDATVSYIHPAVDPKTGTVLVRLALADDTDLLPGAFASVRVAVQEIADCLAVPRESVFIQPDGQGRLSIVENGMARAVAVRVGLQDQGLIQVESPDLKEDMSVVTVGSYALPEATRVRVVNDPARQAPK